MPKAVIYTEQQLVVALGKATAEYRGHRYLRLTWTAEKPRSLNQNALSHVWYEQIAEAVGDQTPEDVKAECKLRFGVPILRREDDDFRRRYDTEIKRLPYETKLTLMRWLPITSLMSTHQLSAYLEEIQKAYQHVVPLQFPVEDAA